MSRNGLEHVAVMVIEDNANMRNVLRSVLQLIGVGRIVMANDGAAALELLRTQQVDILMVDWEMKPMDGITFVRHIRSARPDHQMKFAPIIMVSGHSEIERVQLARDAGVNEFLVKPISARRLMERLIDVIERPRQFVRARGYFGPERRRRQMPGFQGPFRRKNDGKLKLEAAAAAALAATGGGEE